TFLRETLRRLEKEARTPVHTVILDFSAINNLDSSADAALHEVLDDYESRGITLILARVKGPVMDVLERSGYVERATDIGFTESVEEAVERCSPEPGQVGLAVVRAPLAQR
ncbi:MAG: sodium-independent anion transporter, partial [Deltaproteobacteria bacterium]|nr:sodium-independent anion transporter [Deltaproteobacteria bacterium]